MPTAGAVAAELRRIADVFDEQPQVEIFKPVLAFHGWNDKETFLRLVKVFPRPFEKIYGDLPGGDLKIMHNTDDLLVYASITRTAMCRLVKPAQPAEYDCEPLLSQDEEESLTKAQP